MGRVILCMTRDQQIIEQIVALINSKVELIEKTRRITHLLPKSFLTDLSEFEKQVDRICLYLPDNKSRL
jgi:hypothetical protein